MHSISMGLYSAMHGLPVLGNSHKDFLLKDTLFEALSYSLLNLILIAWLPYLSIINEWNIVNLY